MGHRWSFKKTPLLRAQQTEHTNDNLLIYGNNLPYQDKEIKFLSIILYF